MAIVPRPVTLEPRAAERRRARTRRARRETATAWTFTAPATVIILGLGIIPVIWSLLLSFRADDLVTPGRWVGLDNYRALAEDPNFHTAVSNTLVYAGLYVPLSLAGGLALALALNRRIRLIGLYRTLVFIPFVVSATAQGVLFSFILDPQFGAANSLLHKLGISPQGFLSDPDQALYLLVLISLWSGVGFCVVVFLAALQDVPPELVESARLDGAGRWRVLRHITLPTLTPVGIFLLLWQFIQALQVFDLVYVTTKGGPLGSTTVIVYFVWEQAFRTFTAGYGAAAAYVLALALFVAGAALRLTRRRQSARTEAAPEAAPAVLKEGAAR
ncbi:sugar ABC transporter permease [Streptomyces armeniacus]|uniref:Sugar ABC transporter permease n=1 Tax=Streptomyces armeniacus TaxID=83291 RepID=A0A345XSK7_9ACTN|nr:sugar ABC transporter permease [Streptomyces armeniacus]AXK34623.1 sugar ABC transporter permease [Streptomyces armeniacus]